MAQAKTTGKKEPDYSLDDLFPFEDRLPINVRIPIINGKMVNLQTINKKLCDELRSFFKRESDGIQSRRKTYFIKIANLKEKAAAKLHAAEKYHNMELHTLLDTIEIMTVSVLKKHANRTAPSKVASKVAMKSRQAHKMSSKATSKQIAYAIRACTDHRVDNRGVPLHTYSFDELEKLASYDDDEDISKTHTKRPIKEYALRFMKNWWNDHKRNPYPDRLTVKWMSVVSEMTERDVRKWFANRRVRRNRVTMKIKNFTVRLVPTNPKQS